MVLIEEGEFRLVMASPPGFRYSLEQRSTNADGETVWTRCKLSPSGVFLVKQLGAALEELSEHG